MVSPVVAVVGVPEAVVVVPVVVAEAVSPVVAEARLEAAGVVPPAAVVEVVEAVGVMVMQTEPTPDH